MKIYTYVIDTDSGAAPNLAKPFVTLAICKPRIRKVAVEGEVVIAFNSKRLGGSPHGVRWAGVIHKKLTFHEYWHDKRFRSKRPGHSHTPDNIYRPTGSGYEQVANNSHGPADAVTDLGGEYVLAFRPAWYFGPAAPVIPEPFGLRMTTGRRNHRTFNVTPGVWRKLKRWLDRQIKRLPRPTAGRDHSDEAYVRSLCNEVLGTHALPQHTFDFLRGDPGKRARGRCLPVDMFYADRKLAVEYRERQHTQEHAFFNKTDRVTVSGVHRGLQRRLYDKRRREVLPRNGIKLVELSFCDFEHDNKGCIRRDRPHDLAIVKRKLRTGSPQKTRCKPRAPRRCD